MVTKVQDIMTRDLKTFNPSDGAQSVREEMKKEGIDVAPIAAGGEIRKFVKRKDLQGAGPTKDVVIFGKPISDHNLISKEIPILAINDKRDDLLTIWHEKGKNFSFIVEKGIEAIVTIADLNKPIAGIPFYRLFMTYEYRASNLINTRFPHNKWRSFLDEEKLEGVKSKFGEEKEENAELRLVDCLNTTLLGKVLYHSGLWENTDLIEEKAKELLINDIPSFRNKVMHQRELVCKGQGFEKIYEITKKVNSLVSKLLRLREA